MVSNIVLPSFLSRTRKVILKNSDYECLLTGSLLISHINIFVKEGVTEVNLKHLSMLLIH